eukprot:m.1409972 g.1409972  ORF g.1409972 m.1409972 type:complete len:358 (+) comp25023_c2_seq5:1413-2486(+)
MNQPASMHVADAPHSLRKYVHRYCNVDGTHALGPLSQPVIQRRVAQLHLDVQVEPWHRHARIAPGARGWKAAVGVVAEKRGWAVLDSQGQGPGGAAGNAHTRCVVVATPRGTHTVMPAVQATRVTRAVRCSAYAFGAAFFKDYHGSATRLPRLYATGSVRVEATTYKGPVQQDAPTIVCMQHASVTLQDCLHIHAHRFYSGDPTAKAHQRSLRQSLVVNARTVSHGCTTPCDAESCRARCLQRTRHLHRPCCHPRARHWRRHSCGAMVWRHHRCRRCCRHHPMPAQTGRPHRARFQVVRSPTRLHLHLQTWMRHPAHLKAHSCPLSCACFFRACRVPIPAMPSCTARCSDGRVMPAW